MTDKRVVKETKLRTFVRQNLRSPLTWAFSAWMVWHVTGSYQFTLSINLPIIIFAVALGYVWERYWLRVKWGLEK